MDVTCTSESSAQESVNFYNVPVRALHVSSRLTLARYLNPEMALTTSTNLARDYRGLAELLGFSYIDLQNFQRYDSPTLKILEAWERRPDSTVGILIDKLQEMEREDVIKDTKYLFEVDCRAFQRQLTLVPKESPLQVAEVSSCPVSRFPTDDPDHLTLSDVSCGSLMKWMWKKLVVSIKSSTTRDFVDFSSIQHLISSNTSTQASLPSPSRLMPCTLSLPNAPSTTSSGNGSTLPSTTSIPSVSPVANRKGPRAMFRAIKDRIGSSGSSSGYVSQNLDTSTSSNWKDNDCQTQSLGIYYSTV